MMDHIPNNVNEEIPDDPWNAIELPLIAEDMVQEMVEREETFEDIEMLLEEYEEDLGQLTKTNAADPQTNEVVSNSVLNIEAAVDESFISESEVLGIINPILMDDQNCVHCKIKTAECVMFPCLHFNLCYACTTQKLQQLERQEIPYITCLSCGHIECEPVYTGYSMPNRPLLTPTLFDLAESFPSFSTL